MRKELADELRDMGEKLQDIAQGIRNELPVLSYTLWKYSEISKKAAKEIGTPVKREWEGGGGSWFAVCEDCHGQVGEYDAYCRHCGRALEDE